MRMMKRKKRRTKNRLKCPKLFWREVEMVWDSPSWEAMEVPMVTYPFMSRWVILSTGAHTHITHAHARPYTLIYTRPPPTHSCTHTHTHTHTHTCAHTLIPTYTRFFSFPDGLFARGGGG